MSRVWSVSPGLFWTLDEGLCNQNFVLRLAVLSKGDLEAQQRIHGSPGLLFSAINPSLPTLSRLF